MSRFSQSRVGIISLHCDPRTSDRAISGSIERRNGAGVTLPPSLNASSCCHLTHSSRYLPTIIWRPWFLGWREERVNSGKRQPWSDVETIWETDNWSSFPAPKSKPQRKDASHVLCLPKDLSFRLNGVILEVVRAEIKSNCFAEQS